MRLALASALISVLSYLPEARAMGVEDVPAIPVDMVEVCERYHQTVCPLVTMGGPMNVKTPNTVVGMPDFYGKIVRFEPINGEMGAWVEIPRIGGQLWFQLKRLKLQAPVVASVGGEVARAVAP